MESGGLSLFLPWSLYGLLDEAAAGRAARRTCEGSVLFCDVAGFTPLTEALSVLGREGSEELTRLLNGYFTRMIGILSEEGGDVLRFGGDAMTVFFPGERRERAARGALRMMEAMGEFADLPTPAGRYSLSMKIGAAHGPVHLGLVGSGESGWEYYAAGTPLDDAADAEHHAVAGRVLLHPSFAEGAPESLGTEPVEGGFSRLLGHTGEPEPPLGLPGAPPDEVLRGFIPRHLAERAGGGIMGEHRGTAVVFVSVAGLSWDDPAGAHGILEALFALLARIVRSYQGSLNKLDFGDKGAKALLLFGVPFACEQKEEMASRAALELLHSPDLPPGLQIRIGVTSAPLFSGPVGSPGRREFTVMGDGINLAARLMAAAEPGRALASREIAETAGKALRFLALPPITVKGKRAPVPVFVPQEERTEGRGAEHGLLLEREAAQEILRETLFERRGGPALAEAEAGAGKSALAAWALREARAREIPALLVPLAPFGAERGFSAFKAPVRTRLGAEKGDGPERLLALRDAALAAEEPGFRPLLNPFLDLPEEDSPALKGLSPKERKELTFAVVKRLFDAGGERVLLLDGLQWADPLSLDLLSFLSGEAGGAPWRMALFTRPEPRLPPGLRTSAAALPLPPLSPTGVRELLSEGHGVSDLTEEGLAWFGAKARGNPAVVAALVRSLVREGLLRPEGEGHLRLDEDRLTATAFPDTLEGLYLQQVDALAPAERLLLQEASALGYSVSLNLLGTVSALGAEERGPALAALAAKGLLREDTRGARPYMSFTETLLRDAVYAALPFALVRPLHLRILAALLEAEGDSVPRLWPTLAHHAARGGDEERARRFHRLAGREALKRFDNLSALGHLEFVCRDLSAAAEDAEDAFSLLDAYGHLGRGENAAALLARLGPLAARMGPSHQARLLFFEARALWQRQAWAEAEAKLLEGLALYRSCSDTSGEGKSYVNLVGGVYGPTGRLDEAREALERALALPSGPDQAVWRVTAAMNLGALLYATGRQGEALASFRRAHAQASRAGLGPQRGMIADNLCALLGEMGRFEEAARWGRRAMHVLGTYALRTVSLSARYNFALSLLSVGNLAEALPLLEALQHDSRSAGARQMYGQSCQGLFQVHAWAGDFVGAFSAAQEGLAAFRELSNVRDFRILLGGSLNLFRAFGDRGQARSFLSRVEAHKVLAAAGPEPAPDLPLLRLQGWIAARRTPERGGRDGARVGTRLPPEERLERLLWTAEDALAEGAIPRATALLPKIRKALQRWPYFDAQLRLLYLELGVQGALPPSRRACALRLLTRCPGGVWGLRLLCLLWLREPSKSRARALRQRALRALYFVHARSPEWAWERILAFPEVRAALKGSRP